MADVLLTHSNHLYSDRKQIEKMQPYPPLQTMIAAAVLRENGIETALFDPTLEACMSRRLEAFEAALDRHRPRLVVVCEDDFNFLSKMCLTRNRELAFRMAEAARQRGIPTAVHGSDASDHVREYLRAGFSFVLIGEVEATLLELAQGKPLESICGLAFAGVGIRRATIRREPYGQIWIPFRCPHGTWSTSSNTGRPGSRRTAISRSTWLPAAAARIAATGARSRSTARTITAAAPRAVAAEMLHLKTTFEPDHIWFADDIFALSPRVDARIRGGGGRTGTREFRSRCNRAAI